MEAILADPLRNVPADGAMALRSSSALDYRPKQFSAAAVTGLRIANVIIYRGNNRPTYFSSANVCV